MELEQHPGPIRPACDDVIEIRVLLYEQIAALDGPDALRVAKPKVISTGPVRPPGVGAVAMRWGGDLRRLGDAATLLFGGGHDAVVGSAWRSCWRRRRDPGAFRRRRLRAARERRRRRRSSHPR